MPNFTRVISSWPTDDPPAHQKPSWPPNAALCILFWVNAGTFATVLHESLFLAPDNVHWHSLMSKCKHICLLFMGAFYTCPKSETRRICHYAIIGILFAPTADPESYGDDIFWCVIFYTLTYPPLYLLPQKCYFCRFLTWCHCWLFWLWSELIQLHASIFDCIGYPQYQYAT